MLFHYCLPDIGQNLAEDPTSIARPTFVAVSSLCSASRARMLSLATMQCKDDVEQSARSSRYRRPHTPHGRKQNSRPSLNAGLTPGAEISPTISSGFKPASEPWSQLYYVNDLILHTQQLSDRLEGVTQRLQAVEKILSETPTKANAFAPSRFSHSNRAGSIGGTEGLVPSENLLPPPRTVRKQTSASRLHRVGSKLQRVLSRHRQTIPVTTLDQPAELDGVEIGHSRAILERSRTFEKPHRRSTLFTRYK